MKVLFTERAWSDFLFWQQTDKRVLRRVNELIKATKCTPFEGIGKPEPLKHHLQGLLSRRINEEHRLIYEVEGDELRVISCRYHY